MFEFYTGGKPMDLFKPGNKVDLGRSFNGSYARAEPIRRMKKM